MEQYFRCLEKNPDHRPFMVEVTEHPFFTELPSNDYHVSHNNYLKSFGLTNLNISDLPRI